jgi:hypothetical protein
MRKALIERLDLIKAQGFEELKNPALTYIIALELALDLGTKQANSSSDTKAKTQESAAKKIDSSTYIQLPCRVRRSWESGSILALPTSYQGAEILQSSGGKTAWREMIPTQGQEILIIGYSRPTPVADGDMIEPFLVADGVAKLKDGSTIRKYQCINNGLSTRSPFRGGQ